MEFDILQRINNGQPSLHARCLSAARIQPGERVLHIGCGTGYYSAILSELVTSSIDIENKSVMTARLVAAILDSDGNLVTFNEAAG